MNPTPPYSCICLLFRNATTTTTYLSMTGERLPWPRLPDPDAAAADEDDDRALLVFDTNMSAASVRSLRYYQDALTFWRSLMEAAVYGGDVSSDASSGAASTTRCGCGGFSVLVGVITSVKMLHVIRASEYF